MAGREHAADPVAIVGMACRLPGAASLDDYWDLLLHGGNHIQRGLPPRLGFDWSDAARIAGLPDMQRWGGYLDDVDAFDAEFFGISSREATGMDPAHRLITEIVWEAIEDAGMPASRLAGTRTGVFAGFALMSEYWEMLVRSDEADLYGVSGSGLHSTATRRLSWLLDLRGPCLAVDAACSTTLLAVHLAQRSIQTGDAEMAIVCGANLQLTPGYTTAFARGKLMSPDAACKFADSDANGFVRSEGVAAVLLKPLHRALDDGDRVYATILGSGVSNDGHTSRNMVAPSVSGQVEAIRAAYRDAGVAPCDVDYVEAHGAGTVAGDRAELTAIGTVLGENRPAGQDCLVGSAKSNVGHTETVAGLAGLLKTALAVHHGLVPETLHVREPTPLLADLPLALPRVSRSWPERDGPRLAGVSSLGLAGTNVHVVLGEAPAVAAETRQTGTGGFLLPLSVRAPSALPALARAYLDRVAATGTDRELADLCYSAGARRDHHRHRAYVAAADREELLAGLEDLAHGYRPAGAAKPADQPAVVFVFPDGGPPWAGADDDPITGHAAFTAAVHDCANAVHENVGAAGDAGTAHDNAHAADDAGAACDDAGAARDSAGAAGRLRGVPEVDPGRCTGRPAFEPGSAAMRWMFQVGVAALWQDWGITPDALIGHGVGEVAAATVAGGLALADAARLVAGSTAPIDTRPGTVPVWSLTTGQPLPDTGVPAAHWAAVCTDPGPADLSPAVRSLLAAGRRVVFIEMSPHPALLAQLVKLIDEQILDGTGDGVAVGPSRPGQPAGTALLESLGQAYLAGCLPAWDRVQPGGRYVAMPTYPWQRQRYWMAGRPLEPNGTGLRPRPPASASASASAQHTPRPRQSDRTPGSRTAGQQPAPRTSGQPSTTRTGGQPSTTRTGGQPNAARAGGQAVPGARSADVPIGGAGGSSRNRPAP